MEKLAAQAADIVLREMLKDENKDKLEKHVLDPSVKYIGERLWPYIIVLTFFLTSLLLMTAYIVYTTRKLHFRE